MDVAAAEAVATEDPRSTLMVESAEADPLVTVAAAEVDLLVMVVTAAAAAEAMGMGKAAGHRSRHCMAAGVVVHQDLHQEEEAVAEATHQA